MITLKPPLGRQLNWANPVFQSLLAYWPLNEGSGDRVSDISGNKRLGTLNGDINWANAKLGVALDFVGTNGYIDTNWIPPTGAAERTFVTYIASDALTEKKFLSYGSAANGRAFDFSFENVGGGAHVLFRHFGGNIRFPGVTTEVPFHLAIVVPLGATTTADVKVYIDGFESTGERNAGSDQTLNTGATDLWLGTAQNTGGGFFDGRMEYMMAFSRALSLHEIQLLSRERFVGLPEPTPYFMVTVAAGTTITPSVSSDIGLAVTDPTVGLGSVTKTPLLVEIGLDIDDPTIQLASVTVTPGIPSDIGLSIGNPIIDVGGVTTITIIPASPAEIGLETSYTPSGVSYESDGTPFLFTGANWEGYNFFLEVYMRAVTGTARARLYNVTDNTEVAGSTVETTAASLTRIRSTALTLTNGKEYRVQFGNAATETGSKKGAKLIPIAN